eukprot:673765-Pelagomonas_calceolata.AAC.6
MPQGLVPLHHHPLQASKVHMSAQAQLPSSIGVAEEEVDPELTPEEFKRLQLEVERLGGFDVNSDD